MGYISEHSKSSISRNYDSDITLKLYENARNECIELIEKGYNNYLLDQEKFFSEDETIITAGLYGHIDLIIDSETLPFEIVPEYSEYTPEIKKGFKKPKKAKRFDLRIITWDAENNKMKFGVEAKLLAETNTSSRSATFLTSEYVEDAGMGKFIKKIYEDDGFMLGYILNGTIDKIVMNLNLKISLVYSATEQLNKNKKHYTSKYIFNDKTRELYHIFLNFSSPSN